MSTTEFDYVVIGQGLAGTTLAWCLRWSGARVLVVDRGESATASRVAAGLITPVTGQRLTKTWRFAELWAAAVDFYRRVEAETESHVFNRRRMVRLFADHKEKERFEQRKAAGELEGLVGEPASLVDEAAFSSPLGGFEMIDAGQLDTGRYLEVSRRRFVREESYLTADIDPENDLELDASGVRLPRLGVRTRRIIFCQGFGGVHNRWFNGVRFDAAKGEILTLRIPGLHETRIVHCGVWLAPLGGELFRAGSTYQRDSLDSIPTARGREEVCRRLQAFLRLPFEVVDHAAGVRPIVDGRHPVLGLHPDYPQLGYFNGLASKGALQAPLLASQFAAYLEGDGFLDPELDVNRRMDLRTCGV